MSGTLWDQSSPIEREPDGFLTGVAVGEVTDNKDPDGLARVRVRMPWQEEGGTGYWARTAMPMAGRERGLYAVPEIGDEVLVTAEQGSPSHLFVLGALWNGKDPPPATNADGKNNTRLFRSRSKHEVRFNDDDSSPEIEVKLADGKRLALDQEGIRIDDKKGNTITISSSDSSITIKAGQKLSLEAGQIEIRAQGTMSLNSSGTLEIKGAVVQIN
jgi:uncharacterized protein involved in type VI secretion and phage assembly